MTSSITNTSEEMSDADVIQPTPGTSKGGVRAQKRKKSYKEPSTSESESHSESTNASEENIIKKKRSTREQKKKPAKGQTSATPKDKPQKTRAKDRCKLIDLTNRVRQKGGRFRRYREGYVSQAKRTRCKTHRQQRRQSTNRKNVENANRALARRTISEE